jgi:hypothetical protein
MRIHSRKLVYLSPNWLSSVMIDNSHKALLVTDPFSRYDVDPELTYSVDRNPPPILKIYQELERIFGHHEHKTRQSISRVLVESFALF